MKLFTPEQIEEIKTLQGFYTQQEIAKRYGVDRRRIGEVFNRTIFYANAVKPEFPEEIVPQAPKVKMTFWSNVS